MGPGVGAAARARVQYGGAGGGLGGAGVQTNPNQARLAVRGVWLVGRKWRCGGRRGDDRAGSKRESKIFHRSHGIIKINSSPSSPRGHPPHHVTTTYRSSLPAEKYYICCHKISSEKKIANAPCKKFILSVLDGRWCRCGTGTDQCPPVRSCGGRGGREARGRADVGGESVHVGRERVRAGRNGCVRRPARRDRARKNACPRAPVRVRGGTLSGHRGGQGAEEEGE